MRREDDKKMLVAFDIKVGFVAWLLYYRRIYRQLNHASLVIVSRY